MAGGEFVPADVVGEAAEAAAFRVARAAREVASLRGAVVVRGVGASPALVAADREQGGAGRVEAVAAGELPVADVLAGEHLAPLRRVVRGVEASPVESFAAVGHRLLAGELPGVTDAAVGLAVASLVEERLAAVDWGAAFPLVVAPVVADSAAACRDVEARRVASLAAGLPGEGDSAEELPVAASLAAVDSQAASPGAEVHREGGAHLQAEVSACRDAADLGEGPPARQVVGFRLVVAV